MLECWKKKMLYFSDFWLLEKKKKKKKVRLIWNNDPNLQITQY